MIGMLGSLLGGRGGRMLGGMIGGRTGAMIGGMAGALIGGRQLGGALGGIKNMMSGGDDGDDGPVDGGRLTEADAELLIRAMANAAKADGHVDQAEIDAILGELHDVSAEEQRFLADELAAPAVDARSFAASVPRQLAVDAYVVSVAAVTVDTGHEADYLRDLASGLGFDDNARGAIHDELQIPRI